MSYHRLVVGSGVVAVALAVVAGIAHARLPAGTQLPTHWNAAGQADRFADAGKALFIPVWTTIGLSLLMAALPRIEPLQRNLEQSATLYRTAWIGLLAMMVLAELAVAAPAFGFALPPTAWMIAIGLLLIAIGNVLPKSRPGFFVGIRTPWTLTDPDNWVATHRLGSWTMIMGGVLILLAALLPVPVNVRAHAIIAALAVAVLPPVVYSYIFWRGRTRQSG